MSKWVVVDVVFYTDVSVAECVLLTAELSMPCDQYELQLQNGVVTANGNPEAPVAHLDQSSSTVFALQHGHTNIVLDHKSILHTGQLQLRLFLVFLAVYLMTLL